MRPVFSTVLLASGILISSLLLWLAIANFRSSTPVSDCYLRGMALSLGQSIEMIAMRDPSFKLLADFKPKDVAYFEIISEDGQIIFHSNPELTGEKLQDERYKPVFRAHIVTTEKTTLGTGETVFESQQQLHLQKKPLVLRMAQHTWQADRIIRRAHSVGAMITILLLLTWGLGFLTLKLQQRDISQREQLIQNEHLSQLGKFGATLAHEVRTPLAGIKGYAQLLHEKASDERQRNYAGRIIQESRRLEILVNNLLSYAREDILLAGNSAVEDVIHEVWEQVLAGASSKGIQFELIGALDHLISCPVDRLRQILLNLFNNAVQAMPEGGRLQVVLSAENGFATILIADSGHGFSEQELQRAFEPFFTTRMTGSGLGLSITRKIIEKSGGAITADNSCFGGAEIVIRLPLAEEKT